jgi:hypothetical protein
MQANAELFVPYEPDQADWVSRFPYATIVGKIVYLTAITRPDIAYAVSMLSRFMAQPTYRTCMAVTPLLHYLSRTAHFGLVSCAGHACLLRQRLGHVSGHTSLHLRNCRVHMWRSSIIDVSSITDHRHFFHGGRVPHAYYALCTGHRTSSGFVLYFKTSTFWIPQPRPLFSLTTSRSTRSLAHNPGGYQGTESRHPDQTQDWRRVSLQRKATYH